MGKDQSLTGEMETDEASAERTLAWLEYVCGHQSYPVMTLSKKSIAVLVDHIRQIERERDEALSEAARLRRRKDEAYTERNAVVAVLARLFPSGIERTDIPAWDPEWHGIVRIETPAGQLSWHYHDSHAPMFVSLPPTTRGWDGHDTPEKYRRLDELRGMLDDARISRFPAPADQASEEQA